MIPRNRLFFAFHGIRSYGDWKIQRLPLVQKTRSLIRIGSGFVCCSNPRMNSVSPYKRVAIKTGHRDAQISIGCNVGISGATVSARSSMGLAIMF